MRKFLAGLFERKTAPIPAKCAPSAWAAAPATTPPASAVIDGVEEESAATIGGEKTLFGVKSYLNYFYLSPTSDFDGASNFGAPPNGVTPKPSNGVWYLLPPPPSRRRAARIFYVLCHALTIVGLLLLLGGAFAILVGYCWPTLNNTLNRIRGGASGDENDVEVSLMRIAIDQDEEGNFYIPPERLAELLRDPMHAWKITGFCMFAVGASLMTFSLLCTSIFCATTRTGRWAIFADVPPSEPPIRIYPSLGAVGGAQMPDHTKFHIEPTRRAASNRISPTSGPVPGFEELARVQPTQMKKSPSTPSADELLLDGIACGKGAEDMRPLLAAGTNK